MADDKVAILGMGYVGLTMAVVLSEVGYDVYGIEINEEIVNKLNDGQPHLYEKNLTTRMRQQLRKNRLHFLPKLPEHGIDVYIVSVGTPLKPGTKLPNLDYINKVISDVGGHLKKGGLVCLRSTIPVGVSRSKVIPQLERTSSLKCGLDFHLAFTPERTIEGKALEELRTNPQIVGGATIGCVDKAVMFFQKITPTIVTVSSLEAAEMAKIVDNTYRDVRFAFANELAMISESLKLDASEIISAANIHYQRNNIPVPSPGVGGACLSKDPHILIDLSRQAGYEPQVTISSRKINENIPRLIVERVERQLAIKGKQLSQCTALLVGFAFKGNPETADLRDSTTLWLLSELKKSGAKIKGYDPVIPALELARLDIEVVKMPEGADDADVIFILNNHISYSDWDVHDLVGRMDKPGIFYDGWRMFDKQLFESIEEVLYIGTGV